MPPRDPNEPPQIIGVVVDGPTSGDLAALDSDTGHIVVFSHGGTFVMGDGTMVTIPPSTSRVPRSLLPQMREGKMIPTISGRVVETRYDRICQEWLDDD